MKKVLILPLIFALSSPATADCFVVPSPGEGPVINVRASPDLNGRIIGQLYPHAFVHVQEIQQPWVFISTLTPEGYFPVGWIWLRIADPDCLPPIINEQCMDPKGCFTSPRPYAQPTEPAPAPQEEEPKPVPRKKPIPQEEEKLEAPAP